MSEMYYQAGKYIGGYTRDTARVIKVVFFVRALHIDPFSENNNKLLFIISSHWEYTQDMVTLNEQG